MAAANHNAKKKIPQKSGRRVFFGKMLLTFSFFVVYNISSQGYDCLTFRDQGYPKGG
jgi:hypothetical protein